MDPEENGTAVQEEQRPEPSAEERAAMDEARAGYNRMKGSRAATAALAPVAETPAATPAPQASETPPADSQPTDPAPEAASSASAAPEANPQAAPAAAPAVTSADIAALSTQLGEIRQQVAAAAAAAGAPNADIRKLQGEIGSINRTLKQLAKSDDAPADLAAALAQAEKVAEEFPDIAGPLVKVIKAMQAANPPKEPDTEPAAQPPQASAAPAASTSSDPYTPEQRKAISDLLDVHKDFFEMKKTPEFQQWFAAQSPDFKAVINDTWNPATLAAMATRFKAERDAQQARARAEQEAKDKRKAENDKRLAAAVTPTGTAAETRPTQLSDEEQARKSYQAFKQRKRL